MNTRIAAFVVGLTLFGSLAHASSPCPLEDESARVATGYSADQATLICVGWYAKTASLKTAEEPAVSWRPGQFITENERAALQAKREQKEASNRQQQQVEAQREHERYLTELRARAQVQAAEANARKPVVVVQPQHGCTNTGSVIPTCW